MPLVNAGSTPPPRKTAPKQKASAPNPAKVQGEREEAVNGIFQVASAILVVTNQWADAGALNIHGPNVSRETVKLADKYEKVGNAIDALAAVGPFTAILGAVMPLVLQIAANHKKLPVEKLGALGVKDPRVLESEMRMAAQRQASEYEQEVMEAEKASREYSQWVAEQKRIAQEKYEAGQAEAEELMWETMNKSEKIPVT